MSHAAYRLALRLVALRVPGSQRAEWLAEWTSELWYVCEAAARHPRFGDRHRAIGGFCRGAVEDARDLRGEHRGNPVKASRSAITCCVSLSVLALVGIGLAHVLPGVRRAMREPVYRSAGMVTIAPSLQSAMLSDGTGRNATVSLGVVRSLEHRPQHLFSGLAFYETVHRPLHVAARQSPVLSVGRSSANLLSMLGVPVWFRQTDEPKRQEPLLILSEAAWRTHFGGSPAVFGATIRLGLQQVRLGGVIPEEAAPAGQHLDAWLLMPETPSGALADTTPVHLIGRLAPHVDAEIAHRRSWQMSVPGADGATDYDCVTLTPPRNEILNIFLFTVFLALLALPATTSLSLGDYPARPKNLPWTNALRRWFFLVAKIAMALPAIYFGSLDLTYAFAWSSQTTPEYVQLVLSFSATLFALRWALRDQRHRCPVCLGTLSCPARVGQPSRNFLAWNGTELICVGGHGLLHVPELPTSWCGTQRWLHLDPSWSSLFFPA